MNDIDSKGRFLAFDYTGKITKNGIKLLEKTTKQNNSGSYIYICECHCGNKIERDHSSVIKIKSCGCGSNRKPFGESAMNNLLLNYKGGAKLRNYKWELSRDVFIQLTKDNCFYCGTEPKQHWQTPDSFGYYIYNGIDRVDTTLGYIKENCVTCCKTCNIAKHTLTQEDFINWSKALYTNLLNKGLIK